MRMVEKTKQRASNKHQLGLCSMLPPSENSNAGAGESLYTLFTG